MRRGGRLVLLATAISLAGASAAAQQRGVAPAPVEHGLRITLLGTAGGPPPHADRSQPASLVQIDGRSFLVDAGENVAQQALRAGVTSNRIDGVFITHLHWDHVLGLGYLMATGWMLNRSVPLTLWGPAGLDEYTSRETRALKVGEDIFRPQAPTRPALLDLYPVHEIAPSAGIELLHDADVRVTATPTTHYETARDAVHSYGADRAYAYRFDTKYGSATFTGDTGPSDAVTKLALGSDVLVSEVCDVDSIRQAMIAAQGGATSGLDAMMAHMRQEHLSPEDVGRMAAAAGVKKLVLTHYVMGRGVDPQTLVAKIKPFYKGEIVAGADLTVIRIGQPQ